MPSYILKPNPDADFYVEWSTIVDNMIAAGTRQDMIECGVGLMRLDRADLNGSSAIVPSFGWWEKREFVVHNCIHRSGPGWLQREDLFEYARCLLAGESEDAEHFLRNIDD